MQQINHDEGVEDGVKAPRQGEIARLARFQCQETKDKRGTTRNTAMMNENRVRPTAATAVNKTVMLTKVSIIGPWAISLRNGSAMSKATRARNRKRQRRSSIHAKRGSRVTIGITKYPSRPVDRRHVSESTQPDARAVAPRLAYALAQGRCQLSYSVTLR